MNQKIENSKPINLPNPPNNTPNNTPNNPSNNPPNNSPNNPPNNPPNNMVSHLKKGAISAVAAVSEQIFFGSFLDMLKLEKQRNINNSYPKIAKTFLQQGGIRGLTLGLWPWGVIMYSGRGICFGFGNGLSYDYLSRGKHDYFSETNKRIIAGCMGGAFEGALTSPIVMMRTRVAEAAMGAPKRGFELLPALRAMPINSFKRGTDWALRSFIYFHLKKDMDPMTSGFMSGIIAGTITTPIDRLLPVLQQNNPPKSITTWFRNSIQEKGFRTVFAGTGARVLHAGWNTCFVFGALHLFETAQLVKY